MYIGFYVTIICVLDQKEIETIDIKDGKALEWFSIGYLVFASILPVLHIQWFNRSWLFKCIPKSKAKADNDKTEALAVNSSIQEEDAELQAQVNDLIEQANLLMEQAQSI